MSSKGKTFFFGEKNSCSIQLILEIEIYKDSRARTYDVDIKSIAL